ncbi:MAG: hypothetical protein AAF950_16580 [Pseudomonadota bacterium]
MRQPAVRQTEDGTSYSVVAIYRHLAGEVKADADYSSAGFSYALTGLDLNHICVFGPYRR